MAVKNPIANYSGTLKELQSGDTLPLSVASQTAKTFFAGPTSGSAAAPTFRAISMSDLGTGTPSSSNFLRGDGSWQTVAASPAGSNTQIQYNNSGAFGASSSLTFDSSTGSLGLGSGSLRMPNSSSVFLLATPHASYTGTQNVFIGASAGAGNTSFHSNVYVGDNAGSNTSVDAYFNVFIGRNAGQNTQGRENTFLGCFAGSSNTSGASNVFIGYNTGAANTSGTNNVMIGKGAGAAYNAHNALFIGNNAGSSVTSGTQNTFIGSNAGSGFTTGGSNTALGYEAGGVSSTGTHYSCVFVGDGAGKSSTGNYNIMVGGTAAGGGVSGRGNIIMGYRAAYSLTSGALNVIIGTNEGSSSITTGSQNVFLGFEAGAQETGSNKLYIHNSNSTTPLIYGDFSSPLLRVHGNLYARQTSGAQITAEYDGSNRLEITVGSSGGVTFDAVGSGAKFTFSDSIEVADAKDIVVGTSTGTKIGTSTSQKLGFFNATPVTQRADAGLITDLTGGSVVSTLQDCDAGGVADVATINDNFAGVAAQLNELRAALRDLGLMA